jgi:SAM-dependent methyltransferase
VNVDIVPFEEMDIVADANRLPFKDERFDQIIVQSPYRWEPLESDARRILKPKGTMTVVGHPWNPFIRRMLNKTPVECRMFGWELTEQKPAEEALKFGTPRASDGRELDTGTFIQLTYRRLP